MAMNVTPTKEWISDEELIYALEFRDSFKEAVNSQEPCRQNRPYEKMQRLAYEYINVQLEILASTNQEERVQNVIKEVSDRKKREKLLCFFEKFFLRGER